MVRDGMAQNFLIFIDFMKKLYRSRYMIWSMAIRDLQAKYVGSIFGLFWAVINPFTMIAIYGFVFGYLLKARPAPDSGTDSYLVYLTCGLMPWQFFNQTVNASANTVLSNANLIKKAVGFPTEILVIVTVITNIINHLIGLSVVFVILLIFNGHIPLAAPVIIVYMFLISVFAVGVGWILSSLNVYLRDIKQITTLAMMVWFYSTPVIYSTHIIPAKYLFIWRLNPMYHVVDGYRHALLTGRVIPADGVLYLAVAAAVAFGLGGIFFRKLKPGFAEVI